MKLTKSETAVLLKYLRGDYSPFFSDEDDMELMNAAILKAEALCAELDAYEKTDGDLMTWFAGQMGLSV